MRSLGRLKESACVFFFPVFEYREFNKGHFMGNTTQERNTGKNFTFKKPIKGTFVCCTHLWTVYGKHEATLLARGWEGHNSPNLQFKSTLQVTIWFDLIWFLSQTFLFCHCLSFTSGFLKIKEFLKNIIYRWIQFHSWQCSAFCLQPLFTWINSISFTNLIFLFAFNYDHWTSVLCSNIQSTDLALQLCPLECLGELHAG